MNGGVRLDKEIYINVLKESLSNSNKGKAYTLACVNYAERLIDNNLPVIFDIKHLSLLLGIDLQFLTFIMISECSQYRESTIPKKSGGIRVLCVPSITLKYIQRWILDNILSNIRISNYATGFCEKKSILTNAIPHINKDCVINMDIKDFFPSITIDTIFKIFYYYGYTREVSFALAKLCSYEGVLPQGSPASPYLSNIVCLKLDKRLSALAQKYESDYTRYADDITISGNYGLSNCIGIIKDILLDEGFTANEKKTRIAYKYQRQEVTGLVVNDSEVRVNKKYKKALMQQVYYCSKFGVSNHLKKIGSNKPFFKEHMYGKAFFIYMVEPDEGKKFLDLLDEIEWDY